MKIITGSAIAILTVCAGCAQDPYLKDSATLGASGQFGTPAINIQPDGKRSEIMVGSRLPRESRENAESTKTISRTGYKDGRDEKPGSPLHGGG